MALAREAMLQAMVGYVLQHGLADASLRPLARAAGTSDRMLIYHFGSKQQLIGAILIKLGESFGQVLDIQFAARRANDRQACLTEVARIVRSPQMRPIMRVWMQVLAASAAGETAYLETGRTIIERLTGWVEGHLPAADPEPTQTARTMLVLIEGAVVLDLAGRSDVADAVLAAAFRT
jgi:AcrR family transcriptional regulator